MFPYRRVCTVQAAAAVIWGLLLLFLPGFVLGLLGVQTDAGGLLVGRFAGGMMFALGATLTACRDFEDDALKARVAFGNAACDLSLAGFLGWGFSQGLTSGFLGGMVVFFFVLNTVSWLGTQFAGTRTESAG